MSLLYASATNLDIVQYLLTSKELLFHANIHYRNDMSLRTAIEKGQLGIVKYLLLSSDLKEKPSIYSKWDSANRDIRDNLIRMIKIYNNNLSDPSGNILDVKFTELEKKHFFDTFNYLFFEYADKKLIHWFYKKKELRVFISKKDIDVDFLLDLED